MLLRSTESGREYLPRASAIRLDTQDRNAGDVELLRSEHEYVRVGRLGKGSFGDCFIVKRSNTNTNTLLCLKRIRYAPEKRRSDRQNALREARTLQRLSHACIIRFRDAFESQGGNSLCIVMELAKDGTLSNLLKAQRKRRRPFLESVVVNYLCQLAMALHYLHGNHIMHRDLKPGNIFLCNNGKTVKLGDFGLHRALSSTVDMASTICGTPVYNTPPEICKVSAKYAYPADIWSLGIVIFELLSLQLPFGLQNVHTFSRLGIAVTTAAPGPLDSRRYSADMRNVVTESMLQKEPAKRPTAESLLKMEFVQRHMHDCIANPLLASESVRAVMMEHMTAKGVEQAQRPKSTVLKEKGDDESLKESLRQKNALSKINVAAARERAKLGQLQGVSARGQRLQHAKDHGQAYALLRQFSREDKEKMFEKAQTGAQGDGRLRELSREFHDVMQFEQGQDTARKGRLLFRVGSED
eukprot:g1416.t1